jgi:hypothetical protein
MTSTDDATNFYSQQALAHGLSPYSQRDMMLLKFMLALYSNTNANSIGKDAWDECDTIKNVAVKGSLKSMAAIWSSIELQMQDFHFPFFSTAVNFLVKKKMTMTNLFLLLKAECTTKAAM